MSAGSLLLLPVAAATLVAAAAGAEPARSADSALWLQVTATAAPGPRAAKPRTGATLVLNTMGEVRRDRLAVSLRALEEAAAKRRNPFYVQLDDSQERAEVQKLLAESTPLFTAAAALAAGRWQSGEGDVTVEVVRRCRGGARCFPLMRRGPADREADRARFLAWPMGYAVVLRAPSDSEAARIAGLLRSEPAGTHIALVLTRTDLHSLRRSPALVAVLAAARRLVKKQLDLPFASTLKDIAHVASARDEVPWLRLPPGALLVVPRLSALATADGFVAEVRARLAETRVDWLTSPK